MVTSKSALQPSGRGVVHPVTIPSVVAAPALIEVDRLSVFYGEVAALQDITLTLAERRVTALIGPSGCGKTTFLRALNRMNDTVARTQGRVVFTGENIYDPSVDVIRLRQRVGMVFQRPNPFPTSIFDNVAYGLRVNGLVRSRAELEERVEESLRRAALWNEVKDRLHRSALTLSGGQQQRLCIARALAVRPEVLLMDEPASALDPLATEKIEQLILDLKTSHTLIIVTHNLQQAARVSDETAFFWLGRLVEFNATDALFASPREKLTEDYLAGRFG